MQGLNFFVVLIILTGLLFGFLCVGVLTRTMQMDGMQGKQPCCDASISHQLDSWKNILVAVPEKARNGLMLLVLALVFGVSFSLRDYLLDRSALFSRLYIKQNPNFVIFNHLQLAFARGILNPKVY